MPEDGKTISFRLDAAAFQKLKARADEKGMTPGTLARELVIRNREDEGTTQRTDDLRRVLRQVRHLREDLATAMVAALVTIGKVDPAEAHGWAMENLVPPKGERKEA